ncbi:MAG: phospholipase D family protein [Proteobacteria bacterium]|nr:phospholipase D family protein [Pseudomonadota bacterium]
MALRGLRAFAAVVALALLLAGRAGSATIEGPAFSPDAGAETLVLRVLDGAQHSIRLAAYVLTSPRVVRSLLAAHRRGVDVAVVADYRVNVLEDRSGRSRAALRLLVGAGIPTHLVSRYVVHHDKYIVADGDTVATGSYNYTSAAAHQNSENVLVIRDDAAVARAYLAHWRSRFDEGFDFRD